MEFILVVDGEMDGLLGSGMRMLTGHIDTSSFHGGTISSYILYDVIDILLCFDINQYDLLQCIFCCIMDLYFVINNILYISGMMMIHFLTWQTKVFLSYFPTFLFSSS